MVKKKLILLFFFTGFFMAAGAQTEKSDTIMLSNAVLIQDKRIELLGKKMVEYNESLANKVKMVNGYRLMLLNTSDRNLAMQVRASLLQQYPDQKVYMIFLSPNIKLKFGNFTDKAEAEKMRKQLTASKIVTGNIYLLPEKVELKPEKPGAEEEKQ